MPFPQVRSSRVPDPPNGMTTMQSVSRSSVIELSLPAGTYVVLLVTEATGPPGPAPGRLCRADQGATEDG